MVSLDWFDMKYFLPMDKIVGRNNGGGAGERTVLGWFMYGFFLTFLDNNREQRLPWWSVIKNPSANTRDRISSVGREDTLEEELATHSSILAWRIPWTEEPEGLQSMRSQEWDTT